MLNSWISVPVIPLMPKGLCMERKVLSTGEGVMLTTRGAFSFWHLESALQQQDFLLNEVCSVAKIAGTMPQAVKQRG